MSNYDQPREENLSYTTLERLVNFLDSRTTEVESRIPGSRQFTGEFQIDQDGQLLPAKTIEYERIVDSDGNVSTSIRFSKADDYPLYSISAERGVACECIGAQEIDQLTDDEVVNNVLNNIELGEQNGSIIRLDS